MIELNHISKSYGATHALDDVSLSIGPGERVVVFADGTNNLEAEIPHANFSKIGRASCRERV